MLRVVSTPLLFEVRIPHALPYAPETAPPYFVRLLPLKLRFTLCGVTDPLISGVAVTDPVPHAV